jgi:hypothetical protein
LNVKAFALIAVAELLAQALPMAALATNLARSGGNVAVKNSSPGDSGVASREPWSATRGVLARRGFAYRLRWATTIPITTTPMVSKTICFATVTPGIGCTA